MARGNGGILADFQKFILRGNVIDLAVAVIIGGAFGKIVASLVEDILTPAILAPALQAAQVDNLQNLAFNGIKYGVFLAAILNFLVISFCLFLIIRSFEHAKKKFSRQQSIEEAAAPPDQSLVLQERTADALERLAKALEARNL